MHAVEITLFLDERISELARNRLPDEPGYPSGDSQYASFMISSDEMNSGDKERERGVASGKRVNELWNDDTKPREERYEDSKNGANRKPKQATLRDSPSESSSNSLKPAENGLPPFLSPTLPPAFISDHPTVIPSPLSPTLPGAFQNPEKKEPANETTASKRKRETTPPSLKETPPSKQSRKSPPPPISSSTPTSAKKSVSLNEYKKRRNTVGTSNGPLTPTLQKTGPVYTVDSPRQNPRDKSDSPSVKPRDVSVEATELEEKSSRYLKQGTSLKREADKLHRIRDQTAVIIATQAILYFMLAFACDDKVRKLRGKLQQIEYWKTTSDFIQWVINLQKEHGETELEGLCYQLQAICQQRLFENELRYLRSTQKAFEKQRIQEDKKHIEPDNKFWRMWTESTVHYSGIADAMRGGQSKLSEVILREKFPQTWRDRHHWGSEHIGEEGEISTIYRLPLGTGTSISEAIGFALSILKEFVVSRGVKYSVSEL